MSAARVIPKSDALWSINFNYNGSTLTCSSPAIIVAVGDQVNFSNSPNSTTTINVTFAANPPGVSNPPGPVLFQPMTLSPGTTDGQTANVNGSVNYTVTANGQTFGPYAIQAGIGPLYVQITASNSQPDPIVVPKGGTLQMYSNDASTYTVKWPTFNPFPGLTQASPGPANNSPYTQQGPAQTYGYEILVKGPAVGVGGGRVIVTSG
jgi:hypothetical protein